MPIDTCPDKENDEVKRFLSAARYGFRPDKVLVLCKSIRLSFSIHFVASFGDYT